MLALKFVDFSFMAKKLCFQSQDFLRFDLKSKELGLSVFSHDLLHKFV